jgi:UrcA family protein
MRNHSTTPTIRRLAQGAASALGLALAASSAHAQAYGNGAADTYRNRASEQIEVIAPRHHPEESDIGAPIRNVAFSKEVRFDDLDLRTAEGAHVLKDRIRYAAGAVCRRMNISYPISADNSPPCYSTALDDAMAQADAAIEQARGYDNQ